MSWQQTQEVTAGVSPLLPLPLLNHLVSSVESIDRDVQCLDTKPISSFPPHIPPFYNFALHFSRWGSTSQTCMRTWGMDTTWSPCLRFSLELPWYDVCLPHSLSLSPSPSHIQILSSFLPNGHCVYSCVQSITILQTLYQVFSTLSSTNIFCFLSYFFYLSFYN